MQLYHKPEKGEIKNPFIVGAFMVNFRITWTLCTGEVRKPRLPGMGKSGLSPR